MEQSLFIEWVRKYLPGITVRIVEKLNGTTAAPNYLYPTLLRTNFNVGGKWESISAANTLVRADLVAMNSELPLKKRDSISKASGDIPKMGMELQLNESELSDLDTLVALQVPDAQIVARLFRDTEKCIGGVKELLEYMLLQGLSTGETMLTEANNTGIGVRLNYGYPTENKTGVATLWATAASATPIADVQRMIDVLKAKGNSPTNIFMDKTALRNFQKTTEVKQQFAFSQNFVGSNIPNLNNDQASGMFQSLFGLSLTVVDRTVRYEKNGVQTVETPWADGAVVLTSGPIVGTLEYATLAEENHPVAGVTYTKVEDFMLVSKYRKNSPLSEYTSIQARVVPVINNVDGIGVLDTKTAIV